MQKRGQRQVQILLQYILLLASYKLTFIFICKVKIQGVSYGFEEACDSPSGHIIQGTKGYNTNLK